MTHEELMAKHNATKYYQAMRERNKPKPKDRC